MYPMSPKADTRGFITLKQTRMSPAEFGGDCSAYVRLELYRSRITSQDCSCSCKESRRAKYSRHARTRTEDITLQDHIATRMPRSSWRPSSLTAVAESSLDRVSVPLARQDDLPIPPSAHIDAASIGLPNGERGVETFSSMFSDCGFLVNDSSKRRSILSTRSQAQYRWSFAGFKHEDVLELSNLGRPKSQLRNSQFLRLPDIPDQDRDLESPTTLVEEESSHYQEGSQLARLPVVEGVKLWSLVTV